MKKSVRRASILKVINLILVIPASVYASLGFATVSSDDFNALSIQILTAWAIGVGLLAFYYFHSNRLIRNPEFIYIGWFLTALYNLTGLVFLLTDSDLFMLDLFPFSISLQFSLLSVSIYFSVASIIQLKTESNN